MFVRLWRELLSPAKTQKQQWGCTAGERSHTTRKSFSATLSNVAPDFVLHRSFTMSRPLRCYFWLPVRGSGSPRFRASVKIGRGFGSNQIGHQHPQHHLLGKGSGVKGRTLHSDKWISNLPNCWLTPRLMSAFTPRPILIMSDCTDSLPCDP